MTYEQLLEKIHNISRFGSKLGLERMSKLMELLSNPQNEMKVIHIAGTNGKGSVSRFLYTVLCENGYNVGLYTSPFLEKFTERIEFNGKEISQEDLVSAGEEVFSKVEEMLFMGYESPTEFEIVTAIAFCYFYKKKVDFLVLEVGLGGRGDSTNIIENPVATAITSISFDHMEYLGDTLEKIAAEKAGILKPGVPIITNIEDKSAAFVVEKMAKEKECPYYKTSRVRIKNLSKNIDGYKFDAVVNIDGNNKQYDGLTISMIGMHQIENASCALMIIEVLRKSNIIDIDEKIVYDGMKKARQAGRLEVINKNPYIIIDGAHNEAGAQALQSAIQDHFSGLRILMIAGILKDKDINKILEHFCKITNEFIATEPNNPRKLEAEKLCSEIIKRGKNCIAIANVKDVCDYIGKIKNEYDLIIIAGSLYLIGAVRGILKYEK
ncbi:bifunctional folylpolyglutamate synthase/dihydrofolate synthase [Anaerovorax odorimutans]|uniref:bifunctional folylpolyglutamate synthase/dihydrofolate synthase n=1 Tax=Anaerovorax odorimutans TaxID=109327 RepID=UPI00040CFB6E|nr:folylpolyglutamate synthase/dihydrofolate synthase family protein [Anaerovorax odorimutans]